MKFQCPCIAFVVTADSPACFDISQQDSKSFREDKSGIRGVCADKGKSLHASSCYCECLCECTCECTCKCICECTCQCRTPGCIVKIPMGALSGKITMGKDYMLRREESGGLLFDKNKFTPYMCNHTAYAILEFIQGKGKISDADLAELGIHMRNTFDDVPGDIEYILTRFICGCTKNGFLKMTGQK